MVGKTAVHYGVSPYVATPTTVAIVTLCIEASNAGPPPGTSVVLVGLSKTELNGKRGVVRGYIRKFAAIVAPNHKAKRGSISARGAMLRRIAIQRANPQHGKCTNLFAKLQLQAMPSRSNP